MSKNTFRANANTGAFKRDIRRVRRLLKEMPNTVDKEIIEVYAKHGPSVLNGARSEAPGTGRLRNALQFRIYPKTNTFRLGILRRADKKRFFFARFLEYGRQEFAQKGKYKGRRIGAIDKGRYDMVAGRTRDFVNRTIVRDLKEVWARALRKLTGG